MDVETVNIDKLISPDYNPRHITPQAMESLKKSLTEFGYIAPVIVNRHNNHILAGNQRIEALKQLGYETVEVIYTDITDLNKEKALNIRLNNLSGDWDIGKLDTIFQDLELTGFDLTLTGFATENLQPFETSSNTGIPTSETITTDLTTGLKPIPGQPETTPVEVVEDDYDETADEIKVHVAKGDLFKLGNHYLFCGDATSKDDVEILLNAERERALIDLVFTDPPYGNGKSGRYGRGQLGVRTILGDKDLSVFNNFIKIIPCDKIIYFLQWRTLCESLQTINQANLKLNTVGVWDKRQPGLNKNGGIAEAWEAVIFAGNINYAKFGGNVFNVSRVNTRRENMPHPHQKPLQLLNEIINFIDGANTILDPFGGSGSILMLCEETNRQCYTMELSPEYCQVIINRWEQYTGKKATKIN